LIKAAILSSRLYAIDFPIIQKIITGTVDSYGTYRAVLVYIIYSKKGNVFFFSLEQISQITLSITENQHIKIGDPIIDIKNFHSH